MAETGTGRSRAALPVAMRVLLILGFAIAVAATVLVVVADDVKLLRLAAVLALWAALIAAFGVSRSRRDARAAAMREGEAQLTYQIELQREVAARREYEADLNKQVAATQNVQMAELRDQLERLTSVLSSLADGELTVSRLTLSAESARFRPALAGQPPALAGQPSALASQPPAPAVESARLPPAADHAPQPWGALADPVTTVDADERAPHPAAAGPGARRRGTGTLTAAPHRDAPAAAWAQRHAEWTRAHEVPADLPARHAVVNPRPADAPAQPPSPSDDRDNGVSVSELLAAYGLSGEHRRRRRD